MKATELMIRDWVQLEGKPFRVNEICDNNRVNILDADAWDIQPVPLSAEILKKNGYHTTPVFDNDDDSIIYQHIDLLGEWTWYDGKIYYNVTDEEMYVMFDCKYVHEFQHFLRLCGIQEKIAL